MRQLPPTCPRRITTADPNCLFVDNANGMSGSDANCANASGQVALYDTANSSFGHAIEPPPSSDADLGTIAGQRGCLYSGPTQITLGTTGTGTVTGP